MTTTDHERRSWRGTLQRAAALSAFAFVARLLLLPSPVTAVIDMRSSAGSQGQIFWDDGSGYSQEHSTFFYIRANNLWRQYEVRGERGPWRRLRLDLGTIAGEVEIRRIEIRAGWNHAVLSGDALSEAFGPANAVERLPGRDNRLLLALQAGDPYFGFELPPNAGTEDFSHRTCSSLLVALAIALVWIVLERLLTTVRKRLQSAPEAARASRTLYFNPFWALLISFGLLGACLTFAQPLLFVPDELTHWQQSHIEFEQAMGAGDCVPTINRIGPTRDAPPPVSSAPLNPLICTESPGAYAHIVAYPGVLLSKLFLPKQTQSSVRQAQGFTLARMLQGLMFVGCLLRLGVLARRAGRTGATLVAAFSMSPLLAQQAFGVSADGVQLSIAVMLAAAIMFWEQLNWWDLAFVLALGLGTSVKPFTLPCFIPGALTGYWYAQLRREPSVTVRAVARSLLRAAIPRRGQLDGWFLWAFALLSLLPLARMAINLARASHVGAVMHAAGLVDAPAQLKLLVQEPSRILALDLPGYVEPWSADNLVGPLGWLDTGMSRAVANGFRRVMWFALLLELGFLLCWSHAPVGWRILANLRKVILPCLLGVAGALSSAAMVSLILYLAETPVGNSLIEGAQARYFLPAWIMALGVIGGGLSILFEGNSTGSIVPQTAQVEGIPASRTTVIIGAVLTLSTLTITLPLVARTFIDLVMRYG